jgi:hypothetical protein
MQKYSDYGLIGVLNKPFDREKLLFFAENL